MCLFGPSGCRQSAPTSKFHHLAGDVSTRPGPLAENGSSSWACTFLVGRSYIRMRELQGGRSTITPVADWLDLVPVQKAARTANGFQPRSKSCASDETSLYLS
jgi:hypothetical protein